MDSARWERIQALFHAVADLPGLEQHTHLAAACGTDDILMADVLALLEQDAAGTSLLDRSVAEAAHQVLGLGVPPSFPSNEFGPYRVRDILGEGGMGVVYLAERADLGRLVAIKILRDAWLSPARRERFAGEQQVLAQLNHPSIARLYDANTLADGTPWFVMEYVDGARLTDYCGKRGSSVQERLQLFRSVCEAVQYAHGQAVIHRDLKPSNILVKPDCTVRLLDFGIAKQLESLDLPADQTRTGLRLMTPTYAAPEQIRGERVGVQTDVYSLGVILYELLAGRLPFDLSNLTAGQIETMIVEKVPEKPSAIARQARGAISSVNVPPASQAAWADLDVLCLTAMHKDVQRRYQSVEALIRDIDHYLRGEPLEARPDSVHYRLGKFVRRNRRSVLAAAAVFVIVVGLVAFYTVRLSTARNAALAEAARTGRIQQFMLNLFQGGDQELGPADNLRVVTLLDRGVQQAQALSGEPAVQAELLLTLGGVYQNLGKLDRADSLLTAALNERKQIFGPESREVVECLLTLGLLRTDQARYEEAEQLIRQGLATSQREMTPNDPAVARATATLGRLLESRGAYNEAIPVLEKAVRILSTGTPTPDLGASLTELANCNFYLGRYADADFLNRRVLAMDRQLHGDRHPDVADDLINLGSVQFQWGHYAEAEQFEREALDIDQAWYGNNNPETASAMTILGRSLVAEGRTSEAAGMLREALVIQERVYGTVHPRVASALSELGKIAMEQGKLAEAEADFSRTADIYRVVYGDKHYQLGVAFSNLASVYLERKQYDRAEKLLRQALQRFAETLPADHENAGIARIRLGRALLGLHRYLEATVESLSGYEILTKQPSVAMAWLTDARRDLVAEYGALNRPEEAARFRDELTGKLPEGAGKK